MIRYHFAVVVALLSAGIGGARPAPPVEHDPALESVPEGEAARIDNIVRMTVEQMKKRYPGAAPVARGVHPKDHGCVMARFQVLDTVPEELRVGIFAKPGREYQAFIRYSNADVLIRPDSTPGKHGSRGMAIKLLRVEGTQLVPKDEPLTQDFLLVNHPVFAFANVEDYEALSRVLLDNKDEPGKFFSGRIPLGGEVGKRAKASLDIAQRIGSLKFDPADPSKGAFQNPPASPEENVYYSGAPYGFGPDRAMKYSVAPVAPAGNAEPDVADPNYLRTALTKRLTGPDAKEIVLEFRVQVRTKQQLAGNLELEIENACTEWKDECRTVARITIPLQDFNADAARRRCENLFFTPWHSLKEHRPLGGINRLKLGVYAASSDFRHIPKEPSSY